MGHTVCNSLDLIFVFINRHDLIAQFLQFAGDCSTKPAKAYNQISLHCNFLLANHYIGFGIVITLLCPVGQQEAQTDGHDAHTTKEHKDNQKQL